MANQIINRALVRNTAGSVIAARFASVRQAAAQKAAEKRETDFGS